MSCSQILSGLPYDCETSKGGIIEVLLINASDRGTVTVGEDNIIDTITPNAEAKFKRYALRKGVGSMTSTLNVDRANGVNYVSTDLVLQFAKMDTAKRVEIQALAQNELNAIVKDANGKYWYLGYDEPLTATAGTGQTGTARTDGNYYQITLQDNSDAMPYEVSADIVEALVE